MSQLIDQLNSEPALAWKVAVNVLGQPADSNAAHKAAEITRRSPLVTQLLSGCDTDGHAYRKWNGAHWILSLLADLGCPPGDESLRPLMEETYKAWLSAHHEKHIRLIAGRTRRCASQEGNAIWSSLRLGLADGRTDELVSRLLKWQWPDGGWNCDKRPEADTSSFMETLIPLRALALYAQVSGDSKVKGRRRTRRRSLPQSPPVQTPARWVRDGQAFRPAAVIHPYWHYNILFGLKVMAEAGFISDPRCKDALDLLESKRLPDGGFPAEESFCPSDPPAIERVLAGPLGRDEHEKDEPLCNRRRALCTAHGWQAVGSSPHQGVGIPLFC